MKRRHFLRGVTAAAATTIAIPLFPRLTQARRTPCTEASPPTEPECSKPVNCDRRARRLEHGRDCSGDCFLMTEKQITDACDTWFRFEGFSGETCGQCKRKVNVLGCGPGWFCCCGHYNCQNHHCNNMPHEKPDLGPTQQTIRLGVHRSKRMIEYRRQQREYKRRYQKPRYSAVYVMGGHYDRKTGKFLGRHYDERTGKYSG